MEVVRALYVVSTVLFILTLGGLSNPETSRRGNQYGIFAMLIAVTATILGPQVSGNYSIMIIVILLGGSLGLLLSKRVKMTEMPELVAILHSLVGLAAVLVGLVNFINPINEYVDVEKTIHSIEIYLGIFIGMVTFSGSIVAFGKLSGKVSGNPLVLPGKHYLNLIMVLAIIFYGYQFVSAETIDLSVYPLAIMLTISFLFGIHLVASIGGADMPVVVSMLNSYSGWAASVTGFMLSNDLLIVVGALVGSSGAILSYIMCRAMNRSFISVIAGGFGTDSSVASVKTEDQGEVQAIDIDEFKSMITASNKIAIIPGYGMAVAQAQFVVNQMIDILKNKNIEVIFVIHPVAGRMPGHMNVLLAEAKIPYDIVYEMDEVNDGFKNIDLSIVIGANDIVNPSALEDPNSPIAGMPVIECWRGSHTVVLKRGMSTGYAGVENPLFFKGNTRMLFGDAKESLLKTL
ncbi:MAG: NAD(P)(+) transhydrogenase (Re/Si-specific) subunit beta [Gammaproteobacteria bacterium]|nr:NAD(P)(+) transhydrogenase (Re/Si-specific) subunit beta [Gammaproteobacteria bacterium]MBT5643908.1 NAD(P)(+) transhydrogenase (Re/Si-specific) subunit beta [Gammaproteobacteria bacterium]MBT5863770.1 NAD(P)(+) transhydrogenase (Re/Si-specific) subunit beta [Gammaproteobacteria bacterium]MBT6734247.1 NAD(P)(+) transhydrogenase (Re/Si-specific) subunit beta [Gammaproteobacteria bacterium]MBT7236566.1 NAD(P)(+) transhydrogenase (Re/Si-specific) subunit beta [Gammaproteobacteria bacterium]